MVSCDFSGLSNLGRVTCNLAADRFRCLRGGCRLGRISEPMGLHHVAGHSIPCDSCVDDRDRPQPGSRSPGGLHTNEVLDLTFIEDSRRRTVEATRDLLHPMAALAQGGDPLARGLTPPPAGRLPRAILHRLHSIILTNDYLHIAPPPFVAHQGLDYSFPTCRVNTRHHVERRRAELGCEAVICKTGFPLSGTISTDAAWLDQFGTHGLIRTVGDPYPLFCVALLQDAIL